MARALNPNASPFIPKEPNFRTYLPSRNKNSLRVGTINTRSWPSKVNEINNLFTTTGLDVLAITETWLHDAYPSSILLPTPNHTVYRRDRSSNTQIRGGGVAFLVAPSLLSIHRPDLVPSDLEITCIELTECNCPTFLFSCYRPPHQDPSHFQQSLERSVSHLSVTIPNANVILLGDFNARHTDWNDSDPTTQAGRLLSGSFDSEGLVQMVRNRPTRYSPCGVSSSLIDLVVTKQPFKVKDLTVLPTVSDHCPVIFDLMTCLPQSPRARGACSDLPHQATTVYDYSKVNWPELNDRIWDLPLLDTIQQADSVESTPSKPGLSIVWLETPSHPPYVVPNTSTIKE